MSDQNRVGVENAVSRLVAALGGRTALDAARTETVTVSGWRRHPGRSDRVTEFAATVTRDLSAPRYRVAISASTRLTATELRYVEIGDDGAGHVDGVDFVFDPRPVRTAIPSWRVAARQRHLDLTSPSRLARKLLSTDAKVTFEDGVLVSHERNRPPARILVDGNGVPARVEVVEEHPPTGAARVGIEFGDYRVIDALLVPFRVTISVDGHAVHEEIRTSVDAGGVASTDVFAMPPHAPAAAAPDVGDATEWVMDYVYAGVRLYVDDLRAAGG